jgi:hypothetical protein
MKFDWKNPFEGLVGLALCIALLFLGGLLGLSVAILSADVLTAERAKNVATLWGPFLGAFVGAVATITAAIYNQRRTERRELRRPIGVMLKKLEPLSYGLTTLHHRLNGVIADPKGKTWLEALIMKAARDADDTVKTIEVEHSLPPELSDAVESLIVRLAQTLRMEILPSVEAAPTQPAETAIMAWTAALEATARVIEGIEAVETLLREHLN